MKGRRGAPKWLIAFVDKWDLPWYVLTVVFYGGAAVLVPIKYPDIGGTDIALLILLGGFTSSVGAMMSAIKSDRQPERNQEETRGQ